MSVIRPKDGDRLLWIRFSWFGDVLQSAASAREFKKYFPNIHLTFLTRTEYSPILKNQPYLDEVLTWDIKKRPWDFFKTLRSIRGRYQWIISMERGGAAALLSLFSKAPIRFGYNRCLQFTYTTTHWEYLDKMRMDLNNRPEPALFATSEDIDKAAFLLKGLPQQRLFAAIGAGRPKKLWPVPHWIEFLRPLLAEGWGVVLNGHGPKEMEAAQAIESALQNSAVLNLVGQTPFPLMAAVAKSCSFGIGNDTGPLHLATLVGTPTLGFFGVTDSWGPRYRTPWFRELCVSCPQAGCNNHDCPLDCLADITPEQALMSFHEMTQALLP
ncbi:MAG: glycosyltransferase family 9 protein [Fretibacterium sp.]|nr:glycosyltransferase family 9 protein [Fretibacterium sp.]